MMTSTTIKRNPLLILNFNNALSDDLKSEMGEGLQREIIDRRIKMPINAVQFTYPQVLRAMDKINFSDLPVDVVLNLPRLPIAAAYIVNEFYSRTGIHPIILELIRDPMEEGVRRFGTLRNLELEIGATRRRRRKFLVENILEAELAAERVGKHGD